MPSDQRRRSGALLVGSASLLAVSMVAFLLDGDTAVAVAMGGLAIVFAVMGAMRLGAG